MKDRIALTIWILMFLSTSFFVYDSFFQVKEQKTLKKIEEPFLAQSLENSLAEKTYIFDPGTDQGFGVAKRVYIDGIFMHTISANLPPLSGGETYQTWLVSGDNTHVQTGKMTFLDGEYFVFFQSADDLTGNPRIFVSREKGGTPITPSTIVLEGFYR